MTFKNIALTVALAFGVGACDSCTEKSQESRWGKALLSEHHALENYFVFVTEFEKATSVYEFLDNEIPICIVTVMQGYTLHGLSTVSSATVLYNKSIPGQVLMDAGCNGEVETQIENSISGNQIIRARDEWEQLFKEEYNPLFEEV